MKNTVSLKADFKLITRDPILMLFMFLPVLIFTIFKSFIIFLLPMFNNVTELDFSRYYGYILSGTFLLTPSMLGTVVGFLMIDERDNNILRLMSITPVGYSGYITNRLFIPFFFCIVYTIMGYHIMNIFYLPYIKLLYIAILAGLEGILIGLLLFKLADDKVKGLTYSKGLSVFTVLALIDLFNNPWLSTLGSVFPSYWITKLITNSSEAYIFFLAAFVHIVWLGIVMMIRGK